MNVTIALQSALLAGMLGLHLNASAEDHAQHEEEPAGLSAGLDSHVHGEATLNIALEGKQLSVEFESPAANLIGFEHRPQTEAQRASLARANSLLKNVNSLLTPDSAAQCSEQVFGLKAPFSTESPDHHEDENHHDEDKYHKTHAGESKAGDHSEFHVTYTLECAYPEKLSSFTLTAFQNFPATETIEVQWITEQGQGASEATAKRNVIKVQSN